MKNLVFGILALCVISCGAVEQPPADEILAFVRSKLPDTPFKLTGSLKIKAPNGFTKNNLPVIMELGWGAANPTAKYTIGKEALTITWNNDTPNYQFSNQRNQSTDDILDSGVTWSDLSFSMLWWPNSKLVGEGRKLDRACYIVDVPVPKTENTARLWIWKEMGMLVESQTLNKKMKPLRRVKIKAVKKLDGMWVASDLEIKDMKTGAKTDLLVKNLEWTGPAPIVETAAAFDLTESINRLAIDLYKQCAEKEGNLFLSPYSISTALAMTYGGARGETATQMNDALYFGGQGATHPAFSNLRKKLNDVQKKGHVQLSVANSLWPQKGYRFLPDYLAMTKEFYGVDIEPVDFNDTEAARLRINNWVADKTADKIKDLLAEGSVDSLTRLVLANAIYFKADWESPFRGKGTRDMPFSIAINKQIDVPMMSQQGRFNIAEGQNFQALELPYEGDDLSMVVILPNTTNGLLELENALTSELITGLDFETIGVEIELPKFKFASQFELSDALSAMGIPLAFSNHADFSGMDGSDELSIGIVVHQAFIGVNEWGTEASATTSSNMIATGRLPVFEADHPFLFLIRENSTGTILFIGRVNDPR